MMKFTRRNFLKASGGAAVAASAMSVSPFAIGGASKKVVVVGGGMGGAVAAKYIRMMDPSIEVTLIEANKDYYTCFMSNEVIGGVRDINDIKFGYTGLGKHGVKVVHAMATGIDADKRVVKTDKGNFNYDRCIVAPGIDFKFPQLDAKIIHDVFEIAQVGVYGQRADHAAKLGILLHKCHLVASFRGYPGGFHTGYPAADDEHLLRLLGHGEGNNVLKRLGQNIFRFTHQDSLSYPSSGRLGQG